jgi:MFS family permease
VFAIRAFTLFTAGNFASLIGFWMQQIAVGWFTWETTRSEAWLGFVAFAQLGPAIVFSLIGGVLADRFDKIRILRFGQSIVAFANILLALLYFQGLLTISSMLILLTVTGVIGGINLPARLSITPSLVPRDTLATGMAVNALSFNSSRVLGPLLAAPILAGVGAGAVFFIAALTFGINAWCLAAIGAMPKRTSAELAEEPVGYWVVIKELFSDPRIASVIALQLMAGALLRPAAELFPAFSDVVFGRGESGFAMLSAAMGVGAVLGALFIAGGTAGLGMRRHILWGTVVCALTLAVFAETTYFWVALAILMVHGAAMTTSGIASTTYVQSTAPQSRLGRIMSLYGLIFRSAPAIGAVGLGTLANTIGIGHATMIASMLTLAGLVMLWHPLMKRRG